MSRLFSWKDGNTHINQHGEIERMIDDPTSPARIAEDLAEALQKGRDRVQQAHKDRTEPEPEPSSAHRTVPLQGLGTGEPREVGAPWHRTLSRRKPTTGDMPMEVQKDRAA